MTAIGSLNEKPLHAALKEWYRRPGDLVEHPVDGFVIDLVRDGTLVEIQTRGFAAMRRKLDRLLDEYPVRLVHPVAEIKWIVKPGPTGGPPSRRRSPKRGIPADVCRELVSFPALLSHPHFTLEIVLIEEEEAWRPDTDRGWRRRGHVVEERRLLEVRGTVELASPANLRTLLPPGLPDPFTTADLAAGLRRPRRLAQQVAYCLREAGAIEREGRDGGGVRYRRP